MAYEIAPFPMILSNLQVIYLLQTFSNVIFRLSTSDDLINWNSGLSVHLYVCPSIHKKFFWLQLIWCVGRSRPDMRISLTLTQSKVKIKVTDLLKFWKLHFFMCISSAILAWSSKLMVDYDSMGPIVQLIRARFLSFLFSKLSHDFKLHGNCTNQKTTTYGKILKILLRKDLLQHRLTCCVHILWNSANRKC